MDMGERIKQLRKEKGMTQEELGKVLGVQKSAIRKYEKGEVENIKRSSIMKMAACFNVSLNVLMGWEEKHDEVDLAKETKLLEDIQQRFGKLAVELLHQFTQLNEAGQMKAVDTVTDFTEIEKYSK